MMLNGSEAGPERQVIRLRRCYADRRQRRAGRSSFLHEGLRQRHLTHSDVHETSNTIPEFVVLATPKYAAMPERIARALLILNGSVIELRA
jgi:hypothetical protein